jgi:hypothetical protein
MDCSVPGITGPITVATKGKGLVFVLLMHFETEIGRPFELRNSQAI